MFNFANEIFKTNPGSPILAKFRGRDEWIEYTANILNMLKTEPGIEFIIDSETGELLFAA